MQKTKFLFLLLMLLPSCTYFHYLRIDPWSYAIRSDIITTPEQERAVMSKAKLGWTDDGKIRVVYLSGTPYERGYQQGVLLREEIQDNIGFLHEQATNKFHFDELFEESYERMRPYIPQDYIDEMQGIAHGSRMPLSVIHHIHALPDIGEWGGKKRLKTVIKQMMDGDWGTSCSNVSVSNSATEGGKTYTVRVLDWGLHKISRLHKYPLIAVHKPDVGNAYVNIGWAGFIGAISGMNDQGITLGEMGYGDTDDETMRGEPMPFLLRDVLAHASNISQVRDILSKAPPTNSYAFLMSDGKNGEAELYVKDPTRFLIFKPGVDIIDKTRTFPAIKDAVYGGHTADKMYSCLEKDYGHITPEILMKDVIPAIAMKSNFQNVVYSPSDLQFWVNNASSKADEDRAAEQPYTFFDFKKALAEFKQPENK